MNRQFRRAYLKQFVIYLIFDNRKIRSTLIDAHEYMRKERGEGRGAFFCEDLKDLISSYDIHQTKNQSQQHTKPSSKNRKSIITKINPPLHSF